MRFRTAVAAVSLFAANALSAQSFTNGSLTGPIANGGVPTGWTLLLGSPDTMDESNNVGGNFGGFGATPSASPNGGTWVGLGREGTGFVERFGQTVAGFTAGQTYTISWYVSNFGYTPAGYVNPNMIEVFLGGASIGTGAMRSMSTGWALQSLSFTANASSQDIAFQLGSNNKSYMGIDGISFSSASVVPEPGTYALMMTGLAGLGIAARRRRINS